MPLDLMTLSFLDRPVTKREGLEILKRDQYRCQYCGLDGLASFENGLAMSVDFVVPRARKGKKDPSNLVACCRPCNMIKGTRTYRSFAEAKEYVLKRRKQLRQAWEETANQRAVQSAQEEPKPSSRNQRRPQDL
jgi:5-methylcytosine-specific restriction endonuclease McrA